MGCGKKKFRNTPLVNNPVSVYLGMNISGANDLTCYYDNSYERFTLS
jgi:hypothetical protein